MKKKLLFLLFNIYMFVCLISSPICFAYDISDSIFSRIKSEDLNINEITGGQLYGLIQVYINESNYSQAIELAEKMIEEYPYIAQGYILLAKAKSKSGNNENLEEIYTACIQKCPNDARAYIYRAIIRHKQKRYKEAINDYTMALKIDDGSWYKYNIYANRAVAKYFDGNHYSALNDYNRAISLNEKTDDKINIDQFYYNRGLCRYDTGDIIGAKEDYIKAITLNPSANYFYYDLDILK